jgi:hypothetical protein
VRAGATGDFEFYALMALICVMSFVHFTAGTPRQKLSSVAVGSVAVILFLWLLLLSFSKSVPLRDVLLATSGYCISLFVTLSEILVRGGGAWLTGKRGDKWTKEIDYVYLVLGAGGLLLSVSQLSVVADKVSFPSTLGALCLATALVLRAIKTRAEIAGWNKTSPIDPILSRPLPRLPYLPAFTLSLPCLRVCEPAQEMTRARF